MESEIMVSVAMLAYNHAPYIAQAIESVLMQRVNFRYELVIAEDCSTDGTREIVLKYHKEHPDKIKLVLQKDNVGAKRNNLDLLNSLSGKYIAALEGDDYWTDPLKLQKQVDFLEHNPDYNLCFSNVYLKREPDKKLAIRENIGPDKTYTIRDLAERMFIATPSAIFRASSVQLPPWFSEVIAGDYFLFLQAAKTGKIYYMAKPMAVYRLNPTSTWASKPWATQLERSIEQLRIIQRDHEPGIHEILQQQIYRMHYDLLLNVAEDEHSFSAMLARFISDHDEGVRVYVAGRLRNLVQKEAISQQYKRNIWKAIKNRLNSALR